MYFTQGLIKNLDTEGTFKFKTFLLSRFLIIINEKLYNFFSCE